MSLVCVYVCACVHACIYACVYVCCVYMCVCVCMYACVCICICVHELEKDLEKRIKKLLVRHSPEQWHKIYQGDNSRQSTSCIQGKHPFSNDVYHRVPRCQHSSPDQPSRSCWYLYIHVTGHPSPSRFVTLMCLEL